MARKNHHIKCRDVKNRFTFLKKSIALPSVYIFSEFFELNRVIVWVSGDERLREIVQVIDVRLVLVNVRVEVLLTRENGGHYLQCSQRACQT